MATTANTPGRPTDVWPDFEFRPGDILVNSYAKSGTTWLQMICALLVFQTAELPAPLSELSPWLDQEIAALREEGLQRLAGQTHRRFMKTHRSLDEIPDVPEVTYLVIARNPLDIRVSLEHQHYNLDHRRIGKLAGPSERPGPPPVQRGWPPPTMRDVLLSWFDSDNDKDSLSAAMKFFGAAWERREQPNVVLVHYEDLLANLDQEMRRLAGALEISVPDEAWAGLVEAATFKRMRERADRLAPDPDQFKDPKAFFRRGRSGSWRTHLSAADYDRYRARVSALAPPDLVTWLHRDSA